MHSGWSGSASRTDHPAGRPNPPGAQATGAVACPAVRAGLLSVCAAAVLWGTGGLAMQLIGHHSELGTTTVSAWRMGIAAVVVLAVVAVRHAWGEVAASVRRHPVRAVLVGVGVGGYQALYFGAVVAVGVSVATVVSLGIAPVLLTATEHARLRTRPSGAEAAILAAALLGLALVSGGGTDGDRPTLGIVLALLSGTTYAITTVIGHAMSASESPLAITACTTVFGTLFLLPIAAIAGGPFTTGDGEAIALLAYLGVMTLALAYGLLYAGLRSIKPSTATIASLLEPVTAAIAAAIVLDEQVGPLGVAGTLAILAAVAGLTLLSP